ncbi:hypothetical protein FRC0129_00004 [Corynebacterium diphtheriae]|nr:hypothetical protein CIP107549_00004 [Corynebacterium diphtheriae]CAB0728274.1 hypothetical protein FRC0129_00004 [Corynebacterium diphtheriae]
MTLEIHDFDEFFTSVNQGHKPFTWQVKLVEFIVTHGYWPRQISAPTGSGKSSVVDVHVFVNALSALGVAPRIPRRLHTVVNRRGLVDNQHQHAKELSQLLYEAQGTNTVCGKVADALSLFQVRADNHSPLITSVLRGGLSTKTLPVEDPTSCAIIASTPDMWGSRALFKGYGTSRLAQPREAAIMTMDSVLIIDEAHLNQQLLATARRIREIQNNEVATGIPLLETVETTATPISHGLEQDSITVDPREFDSKRDNLLQQRLFSSKQLVLHVLPQWNGCAGNASLIRAMTNEIKRLTDERGSNGTVGCIVNHVDTATGISLALKKAGLSVKTLVGRMRPADLTNLMRDHPRLLTAQGDPSVDVIVATQTLEVGVDVDFCHLVTELAPGSSLAQRLGRLNRLGKYKYSESVIFIPEENKVFKEEYPPYQGKDLEAAAQWLRSFEKGSSLNPAVVSSRPAPTAAPMRLLFQRLEETELCELARTSHAPYSEPDLSIWLRDSLESDATTGGIVVRENLPQDDNAAIQLLATVPPENEEIFPSSHVIMRILSEALVMDEDKRFKAELKEPTLRRRAFLYRDSVVTQLAPDSKIKPSDILIIDRGISFTTEKVASEKPQDKHAPKPAQIEGIEVYLFGEDLPEIIQDLFFDAVSMNADELSQAWSNALKIPQKISLETATVTTTDSRFQREVPTWIVVKYPEILKKDQRVIQEWSTTKRVSLSNHQKDVADRGKAIAQSLQLVPELARSVHTACAHHDDGKTDLRFQKMLGQKTPSTHLAKSGYRNKHTADLARAGSGLPIGWRHEQYSALLAAKQQQIDSTSIDDLALRIIGTSHGHGRDTFPHTAEMLLPEGHDLYELAHFLFTQGAWSSLIHRTNRRYGIYAVAFLEALERAADSQISGEGR